MSEVLYYVQDSRGYIGNCISWWAKGSGYTSNIDKADVFTEDEAKEVYNNRITDVPWLKSYVDKHLTKTVDSQHVSLEVSFSISNIKRRKKPKYKKPRYKCGGCGVFMSEENFYTKACDKCGAYNRP